MSFSKNQKKVFWLQKWNKTYLAVLLGYETIIWHHHSQNLGFSYVLMPAHCDFVLCTSFLLCNTNSQKYANRYTAGWNVWGDWVLAVYHHNHKNWVPSILIHNLWLIFIWMKQKKFFVWKNKIQNGQKTQKMHFWPVFELMSDSLTAI